MLTLTWYSKRLNGSWPSRWDRFVCWLIGHHWHFDAYGHKLNPFDATYCRQTTHYVDNSVRAVGRYRVCERCGYYEFFPERWEVKPLPTMEA